MNTSRELWRASHGPIPKGWVVINMNGNSEDNRLENLAAIPRNPDHIGWVIAPLRERIRNLERELKLLKEKS